MPNCIILRGLPGSGKSSIADKTDCYQVSADFYFVNQFTGTYTFDRSKLGSAHDKCFADFKQYVDWNRNVVVDNTNTTKKEYQRYVDYATKAAYNVTILTVETLHTDEELAKRNVHGVPVETIKRMRERMNSNG